MPVTAPAAVAYFEVMSGPNTAPRYITIVDRALYGRLGDLGHAALLDTRVSRKHFTVAFTDGRWVLHDLSGGYTAVDNAYASGGMVLTNGSEIVLGDAVILRVHLPAVSAGYIETTR